MEVEKNGKELLPEGLPLPGAFAIYLFLFGFLSP